ncbi:hypothetical protein HH299_02750, partial [Xanthomonas sp. Kuri4-2]
MQCSYCGATVVPASAPPVARASFTEAQRRAQAEADPQADLRCGHDRYRVLGPLGQG